MQKITVCLFRNRSFARSSPGALTGYALSALVVLLLLATRYSSAQALSSPTPSAPAQAAPAQAAPAQAAPAQAAPAQTVPAQTAPAQSVDDSYQTPEEVPYTAEGNAAKWHVTVSPYLWTAGLRGNLHLRGYHAAVRQSFGDIMSNLKVGGMGLVEVRHRRVGLLVDTFFLRVGDQKAILVPHLQVDPEVGLHSTIFTLTPELAYRLYDHRLFAVDALAGLAYLHLGVGLKLQAGPHLHLSHSVSSNWADGLGGARFLLRPTPRVRAYLIGNAGGGGARPNWQLNYGVGYRVTPRVTAQLGYRRIYFDRHEGDGFSFDTTVQGLLFGATIHLR